ncbi:MAG: hypothetical protein R3D29_12505 [Nitratireductor sp.]
MKLNAAAKMIPLLARNQRYPSFLAATLSGWLQRHDRRSGSLAFGKLPALQRFPFQPNAGSEGEYAGLMAIRRYHTRPMVARTAISA